MDFAPYVPSVNRAGVVAFQAALADGRTGVYAGDGDVPVVIAESGVAGLGAVTSHPDIDAAGRVSFYGETDTGEQALYFGEPGGVSAVVRGLGDLAGIGPAGPAMNDAGWIGLRATRGDGGAGMYLYGEGQRVTIAETGWFSSFEGLPVVNRRGSVVIRANHPDGGQGIYLHRAGVLQPVVETGAVFQALGRFPDLDDDDAVVFAALRRDGRSGVHWAAGGWVDTVMGSGAGYTVFRGALIGGTGSVVGIASTEDTPLGVFGGPDPVRDRVVAVGDTLFGSTVTDLALNPVSGNQAGQLAIRLTLASGVQRIVRADRA